MSQLNSILTDRLLYGLPITKVSQTDGRSVASLCNELIDYIKVSTGELFIFSWNLFYLRQSPLAEAAGIPDADPEVMHAIEQKRAELFDALTRYDGAVYIVIPDSRLPDARRFFEVRAEQLGAPAAKDGLIAENRAGLDSAWRLKEARGNKATHVMAAPAPLPGRLFLSNQVCFFQPYEWNRHGIESHAGMILRTRQPIEFNVVDAAVRAVIALLA